MSFSFRERMHITLLGQRGTTVEKQNRAKKQMTEHKDIEN
jgi:hypothetical protein